MLDGLILLAADTPASLQQVRARLRADGYGVITAERGADAIDLLGRERPDLVILDLMMASMAGLETLRAMRRVSTVPMILLTAQGGDADVMRAFASGADDYLIKPFNPDELAARVRAALYRVRAAALFPLERVLRYPNLEIDLERRSVTVAGAEVRLSATEWQLLALLGANAGKVMRHSQLLWPIWGPESGEDVHYLRTWVSRIRAKLEPNGSHVLITTYPGIGYRLELPASELPNLLQV